MIDLRGIEQRWEADGSKRDERGRRVFAASEARAAGRGGLTAVSAITGLARSTIGRGLKDLDAPPLRHGRVRREGGGPRPLIDRDPTLLTDLERLVAPATRGDPERPLLWVSKSLDKLAAALTEMGHAISPNSVRKLLIGLGFSRQSNRKADEGSRHPDRDAQFEHINGKVIAAQAAGQPVISVDTKKKELIGNFKNGGAEEAREGLVQVQMYAQFFGGSNVPDAYSELPGTILFPSEIDAHKQLIKCLRAAHIAGLKNSSTGRFQETLKHFVVPPAN